MTTKKTIEKSAYVLAVQEARTAVFNSVNPHFKSKFANEKACKEATDPALFKHGLAMVHHLHIEPSFHLLTQVLDESGDAVASSFYPLAISKPQDMGSQITYAKRYNRCALMGIISDQDDDGNGAEDNAAKSELINTDQKKELLALIKETDTDVKAYLKNIEFADIDAITVDKFENVKGKLENKKKQMEAINTAKGKV